MLRHLLDDQLSYLTLQKRLYLAGTIKNEKPHLEALLDLLLPKAAFPDLAVYDLCKAAGESTPRVLSYLLDQNVKSIVFAIRYGMGFIFQAIVPIGRAKQEFARSWRNIQSYRGCCRTSFEQA